MHTRNAAFKAKYGSVGFKWIIFGIEQVLLVRGYLPGTGTQFYYLGRLTQRHTYALIEEELRYCTVVQGSGKTHVRSQV